MISPTQRSLKWLRDQGYISQVVERWNMFAHIRQDLFGCIDIVGVNAKETGVLGIQATTTGNISKRWTKSIAIPTLRTWLLAKNRFIIHGWSKKGERGKVKKWQLTEREIVLSNLPSELQPTPNLGSEETTKVTYN